MVDVATMGPRPLRARVIRHSAIKSRALGARVISRRTLGGVRHPPRSGARAGGG